MGPKLEDFEIIDIIGRGSHGTVKKVRRKKDGQVLVWKEIHYASMNEAEKQGLVLEVNLLRELHHPHIVRFFSHLVDRPTGTLFIFMEYCSGGDLHHLISKCRKTSSFLEEGFIWKVLIQVCEALKACHDKVDGEMIILHRDIKPANVFLDKDGNIKLGDFGLARTLSSKASFATTFVGTPYYMSPEVIDGQEYNARSDIWSLGCLVYELCALEPPFRAPNQNDLRAKIMSGRYKRIPGHYSNDLWEIIQEMLKPYEFLRPSAFMLLHHPALVATNCQSSKEETNECLSDSLARLLAGEKENNLQSDNESSAMLHSAVDSTDENSHSYTASFETTVKRNSLHSDMKDIEESVMKEVEMLLKESQMRKDQERLERLQGNALALVMLESKTEYDTSSGNEQKSDDPLWPVRKSPSPPKCVCGGISLEDWKERVSSIRAAEESVRQRELAIEERERELVKRERRLHLMEAEAKQHLVRAQIYLKQTRAKGQTALMPPKLTQCKEVSDFDATTVSADLGYDETTTVAFLDTQPENNPFLKMRENLNKKNAAVRTSTSLCRSNTLDNPKSRKKNDNIFYLEMGTDRLKEVDRTKRRSQGDCQFRIDRDPEKGQGNFTNHPPDAKPKNCPLQIPVIKENLKGESTMTSARVDPKSKMTSKGNTGSILSTLRHNFMRNNATRNSAKSSKADKENRMEDTKKQSSANQMKRQPLRLINEKTYQSKGVCAMPPSRNTLKPSPVQSDNKNNPPKYKGPVFRFYKAM